MPDLDNFSKDSNRARHAPHLSQYQRQHLSNTKISFQLTCSSCWGTLESWDWMIHQTSGQRKFLDCPTPSVSSPWCLCWEKRETSYIPGPELTTTYSHTPLQDTVLSCMSGTHIKGKQTQLCWKGQTPYMCHVTSENGQLQAPFELI